MRKRPITVKAPGADYEIRVIGGGHAPLRDFADRRRTDVDVPARQRARQSAGERPDPDGHGAHGDVAGGRYLLPHAGSAPDARARAVAVAVVERAARDRWVEPARRRDARDARRKGDRAAGDG